MNRSSTKRHAVLVHHGLGDVVMALPMLAQVDLSAGDSDEIHVIVKSEVEAGLIRLYSWRHDLTIQSLEWSGAWKSWHPFSLALRLRALRFASFMAPHAADSMPAAVFSRLLGARLSVGPAGRYGRPGYSVAVERDATRPHKIQYYASFADHAGFDKVSGKHELVLSDESITAAQGIFAGPHEVTRIVMAPMSSHVETHKRWPLQSFAELGRKLLAEDPRARIVVLGAPSEREALKEITAKLDPERAAVVAQPSIEQTMAHLQLADCVVSGCTGPLHLATLVDVPIVALFGPTDPHVTGPTGNYVAVLSAGLDCSPCYAPGYERGCGAPTCMTGIGVERVYGSVMSVIEQKRLSHESGC